MANFSTPFALTSNGTVRITSDPNQIANDRVESLVGTYPGERVMQPDYGVDIPPFVFAPNIAVQKDILTNDIQKAITQWEPYIILDGVDPVITQQDVGIVSINVTFTLSNNPALTPAQIATVEIGGNVVNN
jgi:phage baseplate assembly protein W